MALTFDHVFICSDNPQAAERALTDSVSRPEPSRRSSRAWSAPRTAWPTRCYVYAPGDGCLRLVSAGEERADQSARDRAVASHITAAFREGMPRAVLSSDLFRARSRPSFYALLRTDVLIAGGLISGTFRRFHSADKAAKQVGHTQPDKGPCNQYGYPGHPVGLAHASFRNRGCRQDEAGEEREPNESSARRDQRVA